MSQGIINDMKEFMTKERKSSFKNELTSFLKYLVHKKMKIEDAEVLQSFCQFSYVKLRGCPLPYELASINGLKLTPQRKVTFVAKPKRIWFHKIWSREGKIQNLREKRLPAITNIDPKKMFMPSMSFSQLKENKTTKVSSSETTAINIQECTTTKLMNSLNFTIQEVLENPFILNKYAK
ncbi:hypothetical protein ECANGB1_628 [Enterospora canceri]|uniref:Uncharacterized protein n=1 Tax=Enterospora canceri TaxID=1081671 RepID=A0A1Y1S7S6_9MICR|nr:hypothetical protein ECANGB1_628 [Enterospora canceri]